MQCVTCVFDFYNFLSPFHLRFGYQHVGIQNTSENARKYVCDGALCSSLGRTTNRQTQIKVGAKDNLDIHLPIS